MIGDQLGDRVHCPRARLPQAMVPGEQGLSEAAAEDD